MTNRDSGLAELWSYFVQGLRSNPRLTLALKDPSRLIARLGERWERDEPADTQCPCIRLTPQPAQGGWHTMKSGANIRGDHSFPVRVTVETWVKGSDCTASMELWEAFLSALFPDEQTQRDAWLAALGTRGMSNITVDMAAWGSVPDGSMIKGTGSITLDMKFLT